MKFIKTQPSNSLVENPQDIDKSLLKPKKELAPQQENDYLKEIQQIIQMGPSQKRKIAIFTDAHAMFEPTVAILEDARKQGITEIYSLGDNIGTGPNPKEVMDLLKEYSVQSLKGKHELYASGGFESLEEHLRITGALDSARRNSTWTRQQLTEEQIEQIQSTPESKVIEIGGEKILLTHYINDYNTEEEKDIPDGIKAIFQGHVHLEGKSSSSGIQDVYTLRGAGIGSMSEKDQGTAYYIILHENENGGYEIEKRSVPYDLRSFSYDVNESSMDIYDKQKIEGGLEQMLKKEDNVKPITKEELNKLKEFICHIDPNDKVFYKTKEYIKLKEKNLTENEKENKVK